VARISPEIEFFWPAPGLNPYPSDHFSDASLLYCLSRFSRDLMHDLIFPFRAILIRLYETNFAQNQIFKYRIKFEMKFKKTDI